MPRRRKNHRDLILYADVLHPQSQKLIRDYKQAQKNEPLRMSVWLTQPEFDVILSVVHDRVVRCREIMNAVEECNQNGVIPPSRMQAEYLFAIQTIGTLEEIDEKFRKHRTPVMPMNPIKKWKE